MADRAAELHGGWLWTRGGGASPRGETWRRRWFTLVQEGRRAVLEFRAAQTSPRPLARLALTPSSECIRLVGADARRAANGRNCPAGVVLRFSVGGVTRLARASSESAAEGWIAAVSQAAAEVVASPSTRRASDVDGELARLSARRREMERVDAALRAKSDRLDRRVRALRDVVSPASSPRKASPPEPPGYVVATPTPPAPPDDGEAERAADVAAAAALCARTEAAARDVAARAAQLADAERALSARGWTPLCLPTCLTMVAVTMMRRSPRRRCWRRSRSWPRGRALSCHARAASGGRRRAWRLLGWRRLGRRWLCWSKISECELDCYVRGRGRKVLENRNT